MNQTNSEILTGTAMLSAMWSVQCKDVLEALMPFVRYAIGKATPNGEWVSVAEVTKRLNDELGYQELPSQVVEVAFKRLAKDKLLVRRDYRYYLNKSLDGEVYEFEERRRAVKQSHEHVASALASYLNEHGFAKRYDQELALSALTSFFANSGLILSRHPEEVELLPRKNEGILYHVGQFILAEHRKSSSIFDDIEAMVKGFFVSTALFASPTEPINARFKDTVVFLDTRIILCALGFRSDEERESACQFMSMLKAKGATLACFDHTRQEIEDILTAYRHSLISSSRNEGRTSFATFGFDGLGYNPERIEVTIVSLPAKIGILGLEIWDDIPSSQEDSSPLDCEWLKEELRSINYRNDRALERDAKSVASVCSLRGGKHSNSIERCGALFITTNTPLCDITKRSAGVDPRDVPLVMLETEVGAWLWLKDYAVHGDYPRSKLIEDATIALMPTESVMQAFYDEVDKDYQSGNISRQEYDVLRSGLFMRKELMPRIDGNVGNISRQTVTDMVNSLREWYRAENLEELARTQASLESAQAQIMVAKNDEAARNERMAREIESAGERVKARVLLIGKIFAWVLFVAVGMIVTVSIYDVECRNAKITFSLVVALVLELLGACDLFIGKKKVIYHGIELIAERVSDAAKDKKRDEYRRILSDGTKES